MTYHHHAKTRQNNHIYAQTRAFVFGLLSLCVMIMVLGVWSSPGVARSVLDTGFADLVDELSPAVVNISTDRTIEAGGSGLSVPPGSPLEEFFKRFGLPQAPNQGQGGGRSRQVMSQGSGFIIDGEEGLVVTNNHVIENSDNIYVNMQDGERFIASLIGADPRTDVALLKIESDEKLPSVSFGNSDQARVGDWVIAIGNPLGLGGTVTAGIVSARSRNIQAGPYDDFIQTDAPINRGNSGGPLFNIDGEVIGINTAIFAGQGGGSIGIGFAVPSNQAQQVIGQLREYGQTRRGWLGVSIQSISEDVADSLGLETTDGALVELVNPGSPADLAGMRKGDIVLEVDGKTVESSNALSRMIAETAVGSTVTLKIWRRGAPIMLDVTLGRLETSGVLDPQEEPGTPQDRDSSSDTTDRMLQQLGMALIALNPASRAQYQVPDNIDGMVVTEVAPESDAARKGIRPGMVIDELNQMDIRSKTDVETALDEVIADGRGSILAHILLDQGGGRYIGIRLNLNGQ